MKKLILPILAISLCFACKDDTKKTAPKVSPMVKKSRERTRKESKKPASLQDDHTTNTTSSTPTIDFTTVVSDFIACKQQASERNHCRNSISQIISQTYSIADFKDQKNGYVIYDSIRPIISRSNQWKKLGSALNQQHLDQAMEHTNNGGLSLVIDTENSYGHVVMLVPGEMKKSSSWNLQLPPVLSLLNFKPEKSFNGKALSYAMKKSNSLQVYIRE
ncbi:hypothetical protein [Aquimarina rhabdastrellae]